MKSLIENLSDNNNSIELEKKKKRAEYNKYYNNLPKVKAIKHQWDIDNKLIKAQRRKARDKAKKEALKYSEQVKQN